MHTFLMNTENEYWVGMWVMNQMGFHEFNTLFKVKTVVNAITLVNVLNGGNGEYKVAGALA